jgi:hypothetical protein
MGHWVKKWVPAARDGLLRNEMGDCVARWVLRTGKEKARLHVPLINQF